MTEYVPSGAAGQPSFASARADVPSLTQSMFTLSTRNVPLKMWSIEMCLLPPLPPYDGAEYSHPASTPIVPARAMMPIRAARIRRDFFRGRSCASVCGTTKCEPDLPGEAQPSTPPHLPVRSLRETFGLSHCRMARHLGCRGRRYRRCRRTDSETCEEGWICR